MCSIYATVIANCNSYPILYLSGGKPGEFEDVARAYRLLLNAANNIGFEGSFDRDDGEIVLKSTAHWDSELKGMYLLEQF